MQGTAQGAGGGVRGERCGWGRGSRCVCVPVACVWGGPSTTGRRPVQRCWGAGGARPGEGCVLRRSLWEGNTHICDGHRTRAPRIRAPAPPIPQTNFRARQLLRVPPLPRPEFFTRTTGTARPGRASGHSGRPRRGAGAVCLCLCRSIGHGHGNSPSPSLGLVPLCPGEKVYSEI